MKVREPVARPIDVVAAELLLSASQAFLVGVLMYLAIGIWDDRAVGFGPVAIVLGMLGLAIGGSWLYWLLGGMGWPLAAANVPAALFLGFALVLGWLGEELFRVDGVPFVLSLSASVYGIVCGVFLDSPRRWRWDQRQRPRPGTAVPRISPTTRSLVAQVPRSVPRRSTGPAAPPASAEAPAATVSRVQTAPEAELPGVVRPEPAAPLEAPAIPATSPPDAAAATGPGSATASTAMPTERLGRAARSEPSSETEASVEEPGGIELPTAIEPKAQRSPWAWAAPPEWNRDEDDEAPRGRSSGRS